MKVIREQARSFVDGLNRYFSFLYRGHCG